MSSGHQVLESTWSGTLQPTSTYQRRTGKASLPFGLPGVNKNKKVSNGNYLWISYFWSYLNEQGRAGFVMSSQASSAGHGEKDVRKKIVETGDVDVMISIRGNFFFTRTVPCELWFFDRAKPKARRNQVLMLDARHIFRKVTRTICDFSPEQMANIAAIVWLYRGQRERFLGLVKQYFGSLCTEIAAIPEKVAAFEAALKCLRERFDTAGKAMEKLDRLDVEKKRAATEATTELRDAVKPYEADRKGLLGALKDFREDICKKLPATNERQYAGRRTFDPIAERIKGLIKQVDLLYKLAARAADLTGELASDEAVAVVYERRAASKLVRQVDAERKAAVEQLKQAAYFHRQVVWLQDRFPNAELQPVPGLVKAVDRKDIEAAEWSLTPGTYVGIAPAEPDDNFDFDQTIRDIHVELCDLNREAVELAARIAVNFEEVLGC